MKALLVDKVAVITGGGKGQGRASAVLFAQEGAKVVIADWDEASAQDAAKEIVAAGGEAIAVKIDVSKEADIKKMIAAALDTYGRLDILFNNAGIGYSERGRYYMGSVVDTPDEDWDAINAINLKGVALVCKHAIPVMIKQGGGVILNSGSGNAIHSTPGADAYTAAKGGVVALTRVLADVYGPNGIRVNCICPGAVLTPMIADIYGIAGGPLEKWSARVPLRRVGEPEELAMAALFFVSDMSSYITGTIVPVDGGRDCQ
jgi:NAD(P)-dependent dehydrogenase (short-subunit alcohol dehydrogenase family)